MKIVVDSNIVFSAILNSKSKIGQLIINGSQYFDFYTVVLLKHEIIEHSDKILKSSGFTPDELNEVIQLIISRIKFVDDILINEKDIDNAIDLVSGIDNNDAMFVALNNHLKANLWTGDKRLVNGLKKKGYLRILNVDELYEIFILKQLKSRQKRK